MKDIESFQPKKRSTSLSCVNAFIIASGFEFSLDNFCESDSKSLIKVINKPLLAYQLEFLERQGIREVFIITNKKYYQGINEYILSQFIGEIKTEMITTKENFDLFNVIESKVTKSNFILLSGDSIIDFDLNSFIDNHILEHSLLSLVLNEDTQKFSNQRFRFLPALPTQLFGITKKKTEYLHRLVYLSQKEQGELFTLKKTILKHNPNFRLVYNYEDIHCYLFNANVFNLDRDELIQMTSIKSYLVPHLINKSHSNKLNSQLREKAKDKKLLVDRITVKCHMISNVNEIGDYAYPISSLVKLFNSITEIQKTYTTIPDVLFQTKNNMKNYFMNFSSAIQANVDNNKQFSEGIAEIDSISIDSYVSDPVNSLGKKCRINKTISGSNLTVGEGSKVTNCLLFNNIVIGKECKITNTLIGDNVTIGDNNTITDCIIPSYSIIKPKSELLGLKVFGDQF